MLKKCLCHYSVQVQKQCFEAGGDISSSDKLPRGRSSIAVARSVVLDGATATGSLRVCSSTALSPVLVEGDTCAAVASI